MNRSYSVLKPMSCKLTIGFFYLAVCNILFLVLFFHQEILLHDWSYFTARVWEDCGGFTWFSFNDDRHDLKTGEKERERRNTDRKTRQTDNQADKSDRQTDK